MLHRTEYIAIFLYYKKKKDHLPQILAIERAQYFEVNISSFRPLLRHPFKLFDIFVPFAITRYF